MAKNNPVTWWQVNNIIPIVVSVVAMTVTYGVLMARVAVLENKVDTLIAQNTSILNKFVSVENRYGELAIKVAKIEEKIIK